MQFGLNRWDWRSARQFVDGVVAAEAVGLEWCFLPVNPLGVRDPYALMTAAAMSTSTIGFGPLLETPRLRPAPVAAGSIATLDEASDGRAMLVYGIGDTAVRWLGERPARIVELEEAAVLARRLLAGEHIDLGASRAAFLRHARSVPVWIAASGPRTLRMAGRVGDGVFLRVGTHPANIRHAVDQIHAGARDAGRDPADIEIGLIVHTVRSTVPAEIRAIARAMAAGFYEYAPALFNPPGFAWNGPPIHELQVQVWPDFHHAGDLVWAGDLVGFLPDDVAASFSFHGTTADIADQLRSIVGAVPEISIVVPHPVPMPAFDDLADYARWISTDLRSEYT